MPITINQEELESLSFSDLYNLKADLSSRWTQCKERELQKMAHKYLNAIEAIDKALELKFERIFTFIK